MGATLQRLLVAVAAIGIFPFASALVPGWLTGSDGRVALHALVQIALALALLGYVLAVERVPAAELGLRPARASTVLWGVLTAVAVIVAGGAMIALTQHLGATTMMDTLAHLALRPLGIVLLLATMAALTEEIAFRAVLIGHVASLAGGRIVIGAVVSILIFAAMHATKWGPLHVLATLPPAIILTAIFLWKRDLGACVLAHFLTDAAGLLSYSLQHAAH